MTLLISRNFRGKQRGGGKLRGGENIPENPSPKTVLDTPTYDTIPPPLCSRNVILLRENGHRPDKSHFLRPPKLGLKGALYSTFSPPPPKSHDTFPPPFANSQKLLCLCQRIEVSLAPIRVLVPSGPETQTKPKTASWCSAFTKIKGR